MINSSRLSNDGIGLQLLQDKGSHPIAFPLNDEYNFIISLSSSLILPN